jgi:glyoxylase-like metal-dependent hydrolase (beta-lactamase superfamily II)
VSIGSYHFQLGRFECLALSDGSWDYPLKNLFANAPLEQIQEALRRRNLPIDYITTPYTCLYVDTGRHRVLVDVGAGPVLGSSAGHLLHSMRAAGVEPAQIDTVVITHAHPDHVGGALDSEGHPSLPSARYYVLSVEWSFWFSEVALTRASERLVSAARRCLDPLRDHFDLLKGKVEIVPGVRAIPAPGHTPGHMVVSVSCEEEQLLYIGDLVLHPLHLENPEWLPIYDVSPEEATTSKRRILNRAAAERTLVMGGHLPPFPGLGTIAGQGEGWQWQPIEPAFATQS